MKIKKSQAWPIVKLAFPDYSGRKFNLEFRDKITFWDTNWGGGSRNWYAAIRSDGQTKHLSVPAPWANTIEGSTFEIPLDILVVKHSYFCGQDMGVTIYAHPAHQPKWLEGAK